MEGDGTRLREGSREWERGEMLESESDDVGMFYLAGQHLITAVAERMFGYKTTSW